MSDKGSVLERSAEWARAEKQFSRNGKIHILNKYNMKSSLLEEVGSLYSDYKNIQFIRIPESVTLGKKEGIAVLVALYTNSSCAVGGRILSFGDEHTIKPGDKPVEVTPAGEFLFAEKGATDTM